MLKPFLAFALLAAGTAQADLTLVDCEGPNLRATLRFDPTKKEPHGNDDLYLDVERSGSVKTIDVFQILEATLDDSTYHGRRTFFLQYGRDGLILGGPMSAGRYSGIVRIDGEERNVACRVQGALEEELGVDVDSDADSVSCVSRERGQRIQDADTDLFFDRYDVGGIHVSSGDAIGRPEDCATLSLHFVSSDAMKAAKSLLGATYKGMPISYEITGRIILQ